MVGYSLVDQRLACSFDGLENLFDRMKSKTGTLLLVVP